jgi:hypothetical protein
MRRRETVREIMTVIGLMAATSVGAAEGQQTSPLAGLPSDPGPHVAKIQALCDDAWLNLGRPKPDPTRGQGRGRSWCAHMNYAPDLRGAFHAGEGVHAYVKPDGHYMDDLFFYDLNTHRWICIYPGTKAGDDQGLKLNDDGFFVNEDGDLVMVAQLAHNYGGTTYDSDRKKFVVMPNQFVRNWWAPKRLRQIEKLVPDAREKLKGRQFGPWFWNAVTGKFERHEAKGPGPGDNVGCGIVVLYLPTVGKLFVRDQRRRNWLYDPDKKTWTKAAAGPAADTSSGMVACYDSKRDRVILPTGYRAKEPGWFAYDVQADKWIDLKPRGGGRHTDQNASVTTYDSVNDVVVVLTRKGKKRGLYVYDSGTNAWLNTEPRPLPEGCGRGCVSGFYAPLHNAHYYYQANDSRENGTFWLYRYQRAPKEEKE